MNRVAETFDDILSFIHNNKNIIIMDNIGDGKYFISIDNKIHKMIKGQLEREATQTEIEDLYRSLENDQIMLLYKFGNHYKCCHHPKGNKFKQQ